MIPYSRQSIDEADVAAVVETLQGDWLTTGPAVAAFETALADYTGARHAIAFVNGTAALHGAVFAAGVGAGDLAITSPLSFAASANCARYVGATVDFVDIEASSLNADLQHLPECEVLIAVHYSGLPVDLRSLPNRPRVVIEDAAQALGAHTPDGPVGNCARSEMTTFSFHPVKSITTGEGGAVTTNDDALAERLRRFRTHGITYDSEFRYDIRELGYNYRLTDIQAALGTSQLAKLDRFVERRNELAHRYDEMLRDVDVVPAPQPRDGVRHARHLYPIRVAERDRVYREMREEGIGVQVHHVPIYRLSTYSLPTETWPRTEAAFAELLSLPLFPDLTDDQQDRVLEVLRRALR